MDETRLKNCRRVEADINLDAIASNLKAMKALLPEKTEMMAVVKADGYGHGAVPVAKAAAPYVSGFGVATLQEGINLRHHGVEGMILILGVTFPEDFEELLQWRLRPAVFELGQAQELSRLAESSHQKLRIHLAVDTGMSRIGMKPGEESVRLVKQISCLPGIQIEGIFTHFARADERDKESAQKQLQDFENFMGRLKDHGLEIPYCHCSNSAAMVEGFPSNRLKMCRAGISMYGIYPSDEVRKDLVELTPAMSVKTRVSCLKTIEAGTPVSYGGTFVAAQTMRIATIPVGYGDGYPRSLSGKGHVLIRGMRAPVLGRICMDQFMVDVSHIPDVLLQDEVVLMGTQGKDRITIEEIEEAGGAFRYEFICNMGKRIPRVYWSQGRILGVKDYSDDRYVDFL